ncbi:uncharacterized protein BX664DRAFT_361636 [Halteromyces radiatus]|uniref:uncharacterized protein n=1 Tax=Halteromyces radiatus TaxID=101107 RepID=UPI0022208759|nr:uncharacterized protein BX664DRAFT_361636 [Halteromyces radiatus]KAI8081481.1 hypothetical protein BX664DRAFT_361636 [Halteromyces radiatus]
MLINDSSGFSNCKISFLLVLVKRNDDTKQDNALPGYGSSNGLQLVGMTRMETLDGAPNASQPVLQALDLVEDDWCLGSFMNLGAGSGAQVVLGSPANCGMVWKELGDNIITGTMIVVYTINCRMALDLVEDDWCLGSFMNLGAGSSAQALDLVEDDWCLGSFMNLGAGSGAQVVLGSPAICGMVWKELGDNIITVATLLSLRTHDDDDIQLQDDTKHPLVLTRYHDCCLHSQMSNDHHHFALDLVEDDWCLGSFMNLEAGSGAQVVLGSPAICGMVWKELGDNIITDTMIVAYTIKLVSCQERKR